MLYLFLQFTFKVGLILLSDNKIHPRRGYLSVLVVYFGVRAPSVSAGVVLMPTELFSGPGSSFILGSLLWSKRACFLSARRSVEVKPPA